MELQNKFKIGLFACLMLGGNEIINAQSNKKITLDDAIELSLNNNKQLKISNAKIDEATATISEAKMHQLPDITVSGAYLRVFKPNIDLKIPLGSNNDSSSSGGASDINPKQMMYGMASASLPLFSGLRIRNGIESAKYLKTATELDAKSQKDAVIQNTIEAYYNLYKAQAAVKLVEENLKQANQRVSDFSNLEKNGLMARNDLLKAQLQSSNVELTLVEAENNESVANYNMDLMLGLEETLTLELVIDEFDNATISNTITDWSTLALSNRADYQALQQRQQALNYNVKVAKGAYWPSLAITSSYLAGHIPNILTLTNAVNIGIGLQYDLSGLYKNRSKVKQAQSRLDQARYSDMQMTDNIKLSVYKAYQNYNQGLKKIEVYQKAVDQATENYRITKNKYDNALATTTDLLDADVAQLQAKINYEYAKVDAKVAYYKLNDVSGTPVFETTHKK